MEGKHAMGGDEHHDSEHSASASVRRRPTEAAASTASAPVRSRPPRDQAQLDYQTEILRWRTVAAIAMGAAIMLLPLFGDHRFQIGTAVLAFGGVSNLLLIWRIRRGATTPPVLAVVDVTIACGIAAMVPASYGAVVIILSACAGLYVFWFGVRLVCWLLPVTGVALFAIGMTSDIDAWQTYFIAWAIASTFSAIIYRHVAMTLTSQRDRYDELVNGIDAAVWEGTGPSGPADFLSDHVVDLLGLSHEQLGDSNFFHSCIHPDDLSVVLEGQRLIASGEDVEVHFRVTDAWGRLRRLQNRVKVVTDSSGKVIRRRGVLVDETARWEAESSLRRYSDFIEGIPIALFVLRMPDPDDPHSLVLVAANPAASSIVTLDEHAIGHRACDLLPVTDEFLRDMADVVRTGVAHEAPFTQISGIDEVFSLRAVPLPDRCVGISLEDVTKRARTAEAFRHQATHDALTGLANRALMAERLTASLEDCADTGAPVALLMIDLDQFKDVNDSLGHEYGDALLKELAHRMSSRLRDCDTIARLGGDEFAVLLTTDATLSAAIDVARRLNELACEPVQVGEYRMQVSASVGIAVAPHHGSDAETLMRRADAAMYDAKQSGGGHVVHSTNQEVAAERRLELLADLREAKFTDAVEVHFQPRVDLTTMTTVGVEALVRWRHPRHGLLAPSDFIELAEVSGAIRAITQTVTVQACDALAHLTGRGLSSASVNLSTRNLFDPVWADWLCERCSSPDFVPGSLWMELTEDQIMDDPRRSTDVIRRLHRAGVRFSIDDFGSGTSSLALIKDLPVDEVKIDRRFVEELLDGDDRMARSIIDVAHHLGLSVTAEGVADLRSVNQLRSIGCDTAQGFALAPPMPLGDLVEHLDRVGPDAASLTAASMSTGDRGQDRQR